jgi:excisionase family DNA binding protein
MSDAPASPETAWTTQQVADAYQVTAETVRNWITSGQLKAVKLGNEWRILNGDLATFTKERYATK